MATKAASKKVSKNKQPAPKKAATPAKSHKFKAEAKSSVGRVKPKPSKAAKLVSKAAKLVAKVVRKVESKTTKKAPRANAASVPKPTSRQFAEAVAAYEAGIKLMYSEEYEKAIRKVFTKLIAEFSDEPEIQASAKARVHACEKKLIERSRTVFRSADDHYNLAVALLNRGELDPALSHLQQALKLAQADHILYAIAAANALQGNKDQALSYLKQSIHHRPENRFQAALDRDFAGLNEDPAFKELLSTEK